MKTHEISSNTLWCERVQTGVRIEKRLLKVLKALAEFHDLTLGDLLEGIVLHAFDGKTAFQKPSRHRIKELKKFYGLDLDFRASHRLIEARTAAQKAKTQVARAAPPREGVDGRPQKTRGSQVTKRTSRNSRLQALRWVLGIVVLWHRALLLCATIVKMQAATDSGHIGPHDLGPAWCWPASRLSRQSCFWRRW